MAAGSECVDYMGIAGMHDNAAYAARFHEAHVGPVLSGIGRFVDAVAHHVAVADGPRLPGARPDNVVVGRGNGHGADGLRRLAVEDRGPMRAAIGGLPNAARCGAHVISAGVARNAGGGGNAVADGRAHEPERQPLRRLSTPAAPLAEPGNREDCGAQQHGKNRAGTADYTHASTPCDTVRCDRLQCIRSCSGRSTSSGKPGKPSASRTAKSAKSENHLSEFSTSEQMLNCTRWVSA